MKIVRMACVVAMGLVVAAPASAQIGRIGQAGKTIGKSVDKTLKTGAKAWNDAELTEPEEQKLGADVSAKLRQKYGVAQDAAVHKYVSVLGTLLAQNSARPKIRWTFIVLDTDGINAFAAPGGYVHITRGALALIKNEAELACVLAHEITHITAKHTVKAIEKSNKLNAVTDTVGELTRTKFLDDLANLTYEKLLENSFDRGDEEESDEVGIILASKMGYAPEGLGAFLSRLAERNRGLKERSGIFASHLETESRLETLSEVITGKQLRGAATVQPRYARSISYKLLPIKDIPQVAPPAAASTAKAERSSRRSP